MKEYGTNGVVHPTHSCFDDSLEFIEYVCGEYKQDDLSMLTLVHGIFIGDDGKPHTHAWVEDSSTKTAIFAGIYQGTKTYLFSKLDQFHNRYKFTETTRYTLREAMEHNLRTMSYGPWDPKYIALCGDGERTVVGASVMDVGLIGPLPRKEEAK
jgi:hypothetical protein